MKRYLILLFAVVIVWSEEDYSLRERLGNFNVQNHLKGELRLGYIDTKEYDFYGVGGHIHMHSPRYAGFTLNGSLYAFVDMQRDEHMHKQSDLFWAEANVEYSYRYLDVVVGRFMVDTPYADSDDIRIVPNYFQGARAIYCDGVVGFEFLYLAKMAGWESGENIGRFKSLAKVMDIDGLGSLYGVRLALFDDFVWFYRLENGGDLIYLDADYEKYGYRFAIQGAYALSSGQELMGHFCSVVVGGLVSKEFGDMSCFAAYNEALQGSAMPAFGGGPYFTSMEELTLDMAGEDAQSYVLGLTKRYASLLFGVMGGRFRGAHFAQKEFDFYVSGTLYKKVDIESVFAKVIDTYGVNSKNIFRVILKYGF